MIFAEVIFQPFLHCSLLSTHSLKFGIMAHTAPPSHGMPLPNRMHAVSVQILTWPNVCAIANSDVNAVNALENGYPRSFVHKSVQTVSPSLSPCLRRCLSRMLKSQNHSSLQLVKGNFPSQMVKLCSFRTHLLLRLARYI